MNMLKIIGVEDPAIKKFIVDKVNIEYDSTLFMVINRLHSI